MSSPGSGSSPSTSAHNLHLFIGAIGGPGYIDGTGSTARLRAPAGAAADSAGNYYVADTGNHTIRKVTAAGVVTTLAGSPGLTGTADGTGTAARFSGPTAIAVDSLGNLYVADTGNHSVRKITAAGAVTTFAGASGISGSTDASGTAARFYNPKGISVDNAGNLYVADSGNHTIRKISSSAVVTTLAGLAGSPGTTDATGTAAHFQNPGGTAVDASGNVYVSDSGNQTLRKVTPAGVTSTLAGLAGNTGVADGSGGSARFSNPQGLVSDSSGNLTVTDTGNHTIRQVTTAGAVTTFAGTTSQAGSDDGSGTAAKFNGPQGLARAASGTILITDTANNTLRAITTAGSVTTLAGSSGSSGSADGMGSLARLNAPNGICADSSGSFYVADTYNNEIRKITAAGSVTTLAGSAAAYGSTDGTGTAASFHGPQAVAVDSSGNVYVADTYNHAIRKITATGVVTTFAGLAGASGINDGIGSAARFYSPQGVAVDSSGTVYVSDTANSTIRKITPNGNVITFAGSPGSSGSTDGVGTAARFSAPAGITIDTAGTLYVVDSGNHTVRRISSTGAVTTLAGSAGLSGSTDGTGTAARFYSPVGIAVAPSGNIYVADTGNSTVRKITASGVVTTIVGLPGVATNLLGPLPGAISSAQGIVVSGQSIYMTTANVVLYTDLF